MLTAHVISIQGKRSSQEDRYFLVESGQGDAFLGAVFDGHGGDAVSEYCVQEFPKLVIPPADYDGIVPQLTQAFYTLHNGSQGLPGGAVALAFFTDGKHISVVNSGDAEAYFVTARSATRLSEMHRVANPDERVRIEGKAFVFQQNGRLYAGTMEEGLMATRAIGDHRFSHMTVEPYSKQVVVHEPYYLVVATDGLFDVIDKQDLIHACRISPKLACEQLVRIAEVESHDNITAIVIKKE